MRGMHPPLPVWFPQCSSALPKQSCRARPARLGSMAVAVCQAGVSQPAAALPAKQAATAARVWSQCRSQVYGLCKWFQPCPGGHARGTQPSKKGRERQLAQQARVNQLQRRLQNKQQKQQGFSCNVGVSCISYAIFFRSAQAVMPGAPSAPRKVGSGSLPNSLESTSCSAACKQ